MYIFYTTLLGLLGGITWQAKFPAHQAALLSITTFYLLLLFHYRNTISRKQTHALLFGLFFSGGMLLLHAQLTTHLHNVSLLTNKKIDIIATVAQKQLLPNNDHKEIVRLQTQYIREKYQPYNTKLCCNILCYNRKPSKLSVGDTIKINYAHIIPTQHKITLSANPTFYDYLIKENVTATIFKNELWYRKLIKPRWSLKRWLWQQQTRLFHKLKQKITSQTFQYFATIFLGNKKVNDCKEVL